MEDLIKSLIKKREGTTPGEVKKILGFIDEIDNKTNKRKELTELIINSFTDKINLAEKFHDITPFYYDKAGIWWIWKGDHVAPAPSGNVVVAKKGGGQTNYYEQWDEVDILNAIDNSSPADVINGKERQEILQALKQVGRRRKPAETKRTWIAFKNVVVDIETGEKFKPSAEYFFTNPIPHKLGRNAETKNLDKLFKDWVGEEYVKTLYEVIAYCLLKDYPIERIICLLGSGSNGKSCFLKVLRNFLGSENIVSSDLHLLTKSRFETSKLRGKSACLIGETNLQNLDNTQLIKRMTSGKDPIPIEYKNRGLLDYVNYAKLIMATNNLPETTDKTAGWGRRWLIIDFPNTFEKEVDVLSQIPEEEYENLCLKSITFLIDLLNKRTFHEEGTIKERMEKYEAKSDFLQKFLDDYTKEGVDEWISKNDFRKKFVQWCIEKGHRPLADNTISKKLKEKGIESGKKFVQWIKEGGGQIPVYYGIKWIN